MIFQGNLLFQMKAIANNCEDAKYVRKYESNLIFQEKNAH